jgi:hypothetical protein
MLFMVIERFKNGGIEAVGERFRQKGRMQPDDVLYHANWLEEDGSRCFQLMEAAGPERLEPWMRRWDDLMEFEVVPVVTSSEFWAGR